MHALLLLAQVVDVSQLPNAKADQSSINTILSITFAVTGSISLLMVVIGGLRYIIARGEPGEVAKAKNTIIYAVVGLIISLAAFSIVTFVIKGVT